MRGLPTQPPHAALVTAIAPVLAFALVGFAWPTSRDSSMPAVVHVMSATVGSGASAAGREIDLARLADVSSRRDDRQVRHGAPPDPSASVRQMIGQKLMVSVEPTAPTSALAGRIEHGEVGGVILMGQWSTTRARTVTAALKRAALRGGQPPLLVATDQEGGTVRRIVGNPVPSPAQMGADGTRVARQQGALTAETLRAAGVNIDLAPVADVAIGDSFLGSRSFGSTTARVRAAATAFSAGLQGGGIAATAKHFPGLGATGQANTDNAVVRSPGFDLAPFRSLIERGVSLVMVSNAIYPRLDARRPAILSRTIVTALLRRHLGFHGVVISDEMHTPAVRAFGRNAPGDAVNAGADILLYAHSDGVPAFEALLADARSGRVSVATLRASYRRVIALKRRLGGKDASGVSAGSTGARSASSR